MGHRFRGESLADGCLQLLQQWVCQYRSTCRNAWQFTYGIGFKRCVTHLKCVSVVVFWGSRGGQLCKNTPVQIPRRPRRPEGTHLLFTWPSANTVATRGRDREHSHSAFKCLTLSLWAFDANQGVRMGNMHISLNHPPWAMN